MRPWERWLFNATALVIVVTGFAYLWMKYLLQTNDPFAVVNHPWEGAMLAWHVAAAPVMLVTFGVVLNSHVMKKLKVTGIANRRTGYTSLATFAAMVFSGYALQITSAPLAIEVLVVVHLGTGAVFTAAYGAHLVVSWRMAQRVRRSRMANAA